MKTKPIDFTGCDPELAEQLKQGNAVWCECWDNGLENSVKDWLTSFDSESMFPYTTENNCYKNAIPVETTYRYLPPREMLEKILSARYIPDNGAFRRGDRQIPYTVLELSGREDNCPIHHLVCEDVEK